jgi:hypothetical protein
MSRGMSGSMRFSVQPRSLGPAELFEPIRDLRPPGRPDDHASTALADPRWPLIVFGSEFSGTRAAPTSSLAMGAVRLLEPSFATASAVASCGSSWCAPPLTLLEPCTPASDDPIWLTPSENGCLLPACPSPMMDAAGGDPAEPQGGDRACLPRAAVASPSKRGAGATISPTQPPR